jgi:hypothetical protein
VVAVVHHPHAGHGRGDRVVEPEHDACDVDAHRARAHVGLVAVAGHRELQAGLVEALLVDRVDEVGNAR